MIRKANIKDVLDIQGLINAQAKEGQVLPRSLNDIYENLRDFIVLEDAAKIYGCCSLHITWEDLAEIRSLVVHESKQSHGLGSKLVRFCLGEAKDLSIEKVFLLTEKPAFFEKLGFKLVEKSLLPHKIWSDCVHCIKFPKCSEVAMIKEIKE